MRSQPARIVTATMATTGRLSRDGARTRPGYPWPSGISVTCFGSSRSVDSPPDELQPLEHVGDRCRLVVDESGREPGPMDEVEVDVGGRPGRALRPGDPQSPRRGDRAREGIDAPAQGARA